MTTAKDILRTEYLTADKEETLTRVNSRIKDEAFSDVLVFDKKELIGVFSPSRASMIFPSKEDMEHMKIKNLVKSINPLDGFSVLVIGEILEPIPRLFGNP